MIILQYPWLILLSVSCAVLCAAASLKKKRFLFLTSSGLILTLILSGLACMVPYRELALLLLPSLFAVLLASGKGENT